MSAFSPVKSDGLEGIATKGEDELGMTEYEFCRPDGYTLRLLEAVKLADKFWCNGDSLVGFGIGSLDI